MFPELGGGYQYNVLFVVSKALFTRRCPGGWRYIVFYVPKKETPLHKLDFRRACIIY